MMPSVEYAKSAKSITSGVHSGCTSTSASGCSFLSLSRSDLVMPTCVGQYPGQRMISLSFTNRWT